MMSERLFGFSPCPNDTFAFFGIAKGLVKTPFPVKPVIKDVEELNRLALAKAVDVTKLSFSAYFEVLKDYRLLKAGAALGRGVGPILVARDKGLSPGALMGQRIAVPGLHTTACLLLRLLGDFEPFPMPYGDIMPRVKAGEFPAGAIIHEGRFTYEGYGLNKVIDLGGWWEKTQNLPVPLGCIAMKRGLGVESARAFEEAIRDSLNLARGGGQGLLEFIASHAQEMAHSVMCAHIELYVNEFTYDLGQEGIKAVERLYQMALERGMARSEGEGLF